jgi:hypothetical protein
MALAPAGVPSRGRVSPDRDRVTLALAGLASLVLALARLVGLVLALRSLVLALGSLVLALRSLVLALGSLVLALGSLAAHVPLGALLGLLDLVAVAPAGVFVGEVPGLLDPFVSLVRVLAEELPCLVSEPLEIQHHYPHEMPRQ